MEVTHLNRCSANNNHEDNRLHLNHHPNHTHPNKDRGRGSDSHQHQYHNVLRLYIGQVIVPDAHHRHHRQNSYNSVKVNAEGLTNNNNNTRLDLDHLIIDWWKTINKQKLIVDF
jgi:hypothetical protein